MCLTNKIPKKASDIFEVLNQLKHLIGMAQCDYLNNQVTKSSAIKSMEKRFVDIKEYIEIYFNS